MTDTIVFSLYIGKFPKEARQNIINKFLKKESYNIETAKAFMHNNLEYNFTKKHLHFAMYFPSSHYLLHCDLDDVRNEIKFNFSVPKFYYGINLMPNFYHHIINQEVIYDQKLSVENCKKSFLILLNSIFESCNLLFEDGGIPVEAMLQNITIFRVDICKNYLFTDKEEAINYLDMLRKIKVPYKSLYAPRIYETSILWVFDSYSLKVYHKGSEARKELEKLEQYTKGEKTFLCSIADRTLRYELTFRTQKIKDLYLQTFRDECNTFLRYPPEIQKKFAGRNLTIQMQRSNYFHNTPEGEEENVWYYGKPNKKFSPENWYTPSFDLKTFVRLCQFAYEKFDQTQVKPKLRYSEMREKIKEGNSYLKYIGEKCYNVESLIKIAKLLDEFTMEELIKDKLISRASKYNYLKKFKRLGIDIGANSIRSVYQNSDLDGEKFMEEINRIADKCNYLTLGSKVDYLKT